jgi:anti-sigma B factor antagonist
VADPIEDTRFAVTLERRECYVIVHVRGELDCDVTGLFRQVVLGSDPSTALLIDLTAVPFIDSAGLGALVAGVRRVRAAGGDVGIVGAQVPLRRLLQITGIDRIVPLASTVSEAVARLGARDRHPA